MNRLLYIGCCVFLMGCMHKTTFSQMNKEQREEYLIALGKELTLTFGPDYYSEQGTPVISEGVFESEGNDRPEIQRNVGRAYYQITFPTDRLDFNYASEVRIWKDTGEPLAVIFGNGYGKTFLFISYEEQIRQKDSIRTIPYEQPVSYADSSIWQPYSQKELRSIQEELNKRCVQLQHSPVMRNMQSASLKQTCIEIELLVNTPEKQQEFVEQVMYSPAFTFTGLATPAECSVVGINDTLGICLRPEYSVYSTQTDKLQFKLYNRSGETLLSGLRYFITCQDEKGVWRSLPMNTFFHDLGIYIIDNGEQVFQADLYPDVHPNRPGCYRFFCHAHLEGEDDKLLMTEFYLTDERKEWENASKLPAPPLNSLLIVDKDSLEQKRDTLTNTVYRSVEQMPEFPNGGERGCLEFISSRIPRELKQKGRVAIRFIVEKDGSLTHLRVVRSMGKELDAEARRIVEAMPNWIPGRRIGEPVRVEYTIPVDFK